MAARELKAKTRISADETAERTGCVIESFEPGERGGMAAIDFVDRRRFDRQISIHESGHAVASYMLLSVAGSSIEFINGHHGLTWSDGADLEPATSVETICRALKPLMAGALHSELERAHFHCIEYLAGITAEELFCDELLPNTQHDLDAARAVAGLIVRGDDSAVESYIDLVRAETRALLSTHAASVLAIADALVEHRTISGDRISEIVDIGIRT
jgi:hypothetical protein